MNKNMTLCGTVDNLGEIYLVKPRKEKHNRGPIVDQQSNVKNITSSGYQIINTIERLKYERLDFLTCKEYAMALLNLDKKNTTTSLFTERLILKESILVWPNNFDSPSFYVVRDNRYFEQMESKSQCCLEYHLSNWAVSKLERDFKVDFLEVNPQRQIITSPNNDGSKSSIEYILKVDVDQFNENKLTRWLFSDLAKDYGKLLKRRGFREYKFKFKSNCACNFRPFVIPLYVGPNPESIVLINQIYSVVGVRKKTNPPKKIDTQKSIYHNIDRKPRYYSLGDILGTMRKLNRFSGEMLTDISQSLEPDYSFTPKELERELRDICQIRGSDISLIMRKLEELDV